MSKAPIVMISSYPPRLCGIAVFCEEAREFIQKNHPERDVIVISHLDGSGDGVIPIIDPRNRTWWKPVAEKIGELKPYVVHIQHEYGLYEHHDEHGKGDMNRGFLDLLAALGERPLVMEPHTVHGRLRDDEARFLREALERVDVLLLKCPYQKWRLEWNFQGLGWPKARNIMIVPLGARSDMQWGDDELPRLRQELGLDEIDHLGEHLVGLVGWIQNNKRRDLLTGMWEEIHDEILERTGLHYSLFAAGEWRDPDHLPDYDLYMANLKRLSGKGLAHYFKFIPRGELYFKVMAICDFIVLPSVDETQSSTLSHIIALKKPFVTTAPLEGLTSQTLANRATLKEAVIRLACDEDLRTSLSVNLAYYLEDVVCWEKVAEQYDVAYGLARDAKKHGTPVALPLEF
ncbi:MAG: glycosyltransferase family protein [Planctomycetota bacterium]